MKVTQGQHDTFVLELSAAEAEDLRHLIETSRDCAALMFGVDQARTLLGKRGNAALMRLLSCETQRLEDLGERFEAISDALGRAKAPPIAVAPTPPKAVVPALAADEKVERP